MLCTERTCIVLVTPGHPFTDEVHEGTESPWTQWVGVQQDSCENRAAMCRWGARALTALRGHGFLGTRNDFKHREK